METTQLVFPLWTQIVGGIMCACLVLIALVEVIDSVRKR